MDLLTMLLELIETLWNVNVINSALASAELVELIETLWNVNTSGRTA